MGTDSVTTEIISKDLVEKDTTAKSLIVQAIKSVFFTPPSPHSVEIDSGLRQITLDECSNHDNSSDCWIVLYDRVYDITRFLYDVSKINLK